MSCSKPKWPVPPDAVALEHGERWLSYAELNQAAERLAHYLRGRVSRRVPGWPGSGASVEMVCAQLAILKCRRLPTSPWTRMRRWSAGVPAAGLRGRLGRDCAGSGAAGDAASAKNQPGYAGVGPDRAEGAQADRSGGEPGGETGRCGVARTDSSQTAYIMYTSGSTGQPKGVEVAHRGIARLVLNNGYAEFAASDRVAFAADPAFDACHDGGVGCAAERRLFGGDRSVHSPAAAAVAAVRAGSTDHVLWLSSGLFNQVARVLPEAFGSLRYLLVGRRCASIRRRWSRCCARHLRNTFSMVTARLRRRPSLRRTRSMQVEATRSVPIGRPIGNTRIYVLDGRGRPVPIGVDGGNLYRWSRSRSWLSESTGADGGALRARSVCERARSAAISHGRSGAVLAGRQSRVSGP